MMDPIFPHEWPDYDSGSPEWENDVDRFPEQAVGLSEWNSMPRLEFEEPGERVEAAKQWLRRLQSIPPPAVLCPRIFISHRQSDRMVALKMARIVSQCNFHFWLDVLDPTLIRLSALPPSLAISIATAAVIEMALLNCTHVIALRTLNSPGSAWIPYEYGRVKIKAMYSTQAGCWIDPSVTATEEYLYLGVMTGAKVDVQNWLNAEFANARGCPRRLPVNWPGIGDNLP